VKIVGEDDAASRRRRRVSRRLRRRDREPKTLRERGMGRGYFQPSRDLGERRKLPQRGLGRSCQPKLNMVKF